jgi:leucyl-tRNA synthetase
MKGLQRADAMGWDAFGLQRKRRLKTACPPVDHRQHRLHGKADAGGPGIDWSQRLATCDASYYKWNQWLFRRCWKRHGLPQDQVVNWDPVQTVLANEQVIDGKGWHWRHSGGKARNSGIPEDR